MTSPFTRRGLLLLATSAAGIGIAAALGGRALSAPQSSSAGPAHPTGPPLTATSRATPPAETAPISETGGSRPNGSNDIPLQEAATGLPNPTEVEFAGRTWADVYVLTPDVLARGIEIDAPPGAVYLHWHAWCEGPPDSRVTLTLTDEGGRRVLRAPVNSRAVQRSRAAVRGGSRLRLASTGTPGNNVMLSSPRLEVHA